MNRDEARRIEQWESKLLAPLFLCFNVIPQFLGFSLRLLLLVPSVLYDWLKTPILQFQVLPPRSNLRFGAQAIALRALLLKSHWRRSLVKP